MMRRTTIVSGVVLVPLLQLSLLTSCADDEGTSDEMTSSGGSTEQSASGGSPGSDGSGGGDSASGGGPGGFGGFGGDGAGGSEGGVACGTSSGGAAIACDNLFCDQPTKYCTACGVTVEACAAGCVSEAVGCSGACPCP